MAGTLFEKRMNLQKCRNVYFHWWLQQREAQRFKYLSILSSEYLLLTVSCDRIALERLLNVYRHQQLMPFLSKLPGTLHPDSNSSTYCSMVVLSFPSHCIRGRVFVLKPSLHLRWIFCSFADDCAVLHWVITKSFEGHDEPSS